MSSTYSARVSLHRCRLPREIDRELILRSLRAAVYRSLAHTVSYMATDLEYTVERIVTGEVSAVILDEAYLLVYSVGSPWYSQETAVAELMVLRIAKGGEFSVVTDFLKDVADENNCRMIYAGGALAVSSRAISRLYQRHGFSVEGTPQFTLRRA